jgi:TPR repeat protein
LSEKAIVFDPVPTLFTAWFARLLMRPNSLLQHLRCRWLAVALWVSAAGVATAQALAPPIQAQLDAAVIDYESGRRARAQQVFEALAKRGVAAAHYNLAVMHLQGDLPHASRQQGVQLLTRAARGGFVTAQVLLGRALENGDFGRRDLKQAHQWYEVAAEGGSVEAQVAMGTGHYLGRGLPKDARRAVHWFREASKAGDVGAMYLLASMYEQGDGVDSDLRLARYWYLLAGKAGDPAATAKAQELERKLEAPATRAPL